MSSDRICLICGEPVEGWKRRDAVLCRACASGKRLRKCQQCGRTFRGRDAKTCPECRRENARNRAKQQALARRKPGPVEGPTALELLLRNAGEVDPGVVTPDSILALRERLSVSQAEFGEMLGRLRGSRYTGSYVSHLERGQLQVTRAVAQAIRFLDGQTVHLKVLEVGVYALEQLPPGTVILGRPRTCGGCRGWFIFPAWSQRYCSHECKLAARRARRAAG